MLQQKRSDALWRLTTDVALDDRQLVHGALGLGAALLIPGQAFAATFGRVLGSRIAIEVANDERVDPQRAERTGVVRADAEHAEAIRRLVTLHWDAAGGGGALLVTPFNAGHALYVVAFAASAPALRPFTGDDDAFAESIASAIAARVQQRWDAVPERDPLEVVTF